MKRRCSAEITIDALPEAIWSVVSDVTRIGEWSGECRACEWVPPSERAEIGARFRGQNRRGWARWSRVNQFFSVKPTAELLWRTMPEGIYPDSVEWRITLTPQGDATRVTQSFEVLKLSRILEFAIGVALPAHKDRANDLAADLARLKQLVESGP